MSKHLVIVGDGVLAHHVAALVSQEPDCQVVWKQVMPEFDRSLDSESDQRSPVDVMPVLDTPATHMHADLALVLDDGWQPWRQNQAELYFRNAGIPWLRAFVSFGTAIIGPLVQPNQPGCSECAEMRRLMAMSERNEMWEVKSYLTIQDGVDRDVYSSSTAMFHLAQIVLHQIRLALSNTSEHPLSNAMLMTKLMTLTTERHPFLPNPSCTVCGSLPQDSAKAALIELEKTPKAGPNSYRSKSLSELQTILARDYLDPRSGLLNARVHDLIAPYAAVSVNLPLAMGDEGTSGRAYSYGESELTAILEGLERYCGVEPHARQGFVRDAYVNVSDRALDPRDVGLHASQQYLQQDFPFQPFSEATPVDWVWGYSLTEKRPLLVPKLLAYYSLGYQEGFVYETSNGCAVGGSLVEAIFHGILEVVERDAFLMTWYARLPLPCIDVASIDDMEIQLMVTRLRYATGYELHLFDATMENGIPSVFAIAKNLRGKGVNLITGAAAHLHPVRAVKSAIHELAGMLLRFDEKIEHHRADYLEMLEDARKVREMDEHSMLYGLPEAEERLHFLLHENQELRRFNEVFTKPPERVDLREDLQFLLDTFHHLKMNVIVVNQTSAELQRNDLHCVKVLIPGMIPMTFGHDLRRLEGLNRLLQVPAQLGFTARPLTKDELNPHPHPFP